MLTLAVTTSSCTIVIPGWAIVAIFMVAVSPRFAQKALSRFSQGET